MAHLIEAISVDMVDVDVVDIGLITLVDSHPTRPPAAIHMAIVNVTKDDGDQLIYSNYNPGLSNIINTLLTAFQTVAPDSTPATTPPSCTAIARPGPSTLAISSEENTEDINMDNHSVVDDTSV
ncbi:hypothetical protein M422DRAFT_261674 [Sphaerobolus stellatus SS14]|uniref:Uncharacterized protein n=1 Tax=Sphaerobolus stellatus (strain SS14) TaxID=990650 RepID=A0A0C9VEE7_SPHS4|nr:hypothetical protein M422DRAFT_261674 [Sphaerobolus stellatus SS14]